MVVRLAFGMVPVTIAAIEPDGANTCFAGAEYIPVLVITDMNSFTPRSPCERFSSALFDFLKPLALRK